MLHVELYYYLSISIIFQDLASFVVRKSRSFVLLAEMRASAFALFQPSTATHGLQRSASEPAIRGTFFRVILRS